MPRVVVLGAGVAGHTAALYLRKNLGEEHDVVVVSPKPDWNWIPSNIWVGVGLMRQRQVVFPLAPLYRRKGIEFHQAYARAIHPEGDDQRSQPAVDIDYTGPRHGRSARLRYDYLVNATGPLLNFEATPGMGPGAGGSLSVCTPEHAVEAARGLDEAIARMRQGEHQTLVVGTGHGTCTCEGAAFEYALNVEHTIRKAGVRDKSDIYYFTNEYELGDFGVGGMTFTQQGYRTSSKLWTESLFRERGIKAIVRAHAHRVDDGVLHYETLDGTYHDLEFDFAMLLPPFRGSDLQAFDREGNYISDRLLAAHNFVLHDLVYNASSYDEWR